MQHPGLGLLPHFLPVFTALFFSYVLFVSRKRFKTQERKDQNGPLVKDGAVKHSNKQWCLRSALQHASCKCDSVLTGARM